MCVYHLCINFHRKKQTKKNGEVASSLNNSMRSLNSSLTSLNNSARLLNDSLNILVGSLNNFMRALVPC